MSLPQDVPPVFQTDSHGRIVRSHGAVVPRGIAHAVVPVDARAATAVRIETLIGGLYDYARRLRGETLPETDEGHREP